MLPRPLTISTIAVTLLCLLVHISDSSAAEDLWPDYEARCNKVLEQINAGQFADLEASFHDGMKEQVPAAKLEQVCLPLKQRVGDLDAIVDHRQTPAPRAGLTRLEIWVRCTKSKNLVRVTIAFDKAHKITELFLTQTNETSSPAEKAAALANYKTKTQLALPFHGEWTVISDGAAHAPNRNQLHAYDFCLADDTDARFRNSGRKNDDYFTFGQPVLAPGDGCVRQVVDGVEDNVPGERNLYFVPGNLVVIDHQNGEYSFLAHFKQGTIEVKVGQQVKRGDQLGLCGNSGNSSEPHIHYHLANAPLMQDGDGLPAWFHQITIDGKSATDALPVRDNRVSNPQPK